ncbi:uncharacterized protein [Salvelinus alpinus]|uniref:uncharacterized protein n=1 Tax=Salvelinus alpinus TaxID=8036 RepID=UPI0039FC66ED
MVRTLNTMAELRASRFGCPWPRHGLKLLFWFANDYIVFDDDNQMVANYDPEEGDFGFHDFKNKLEYENNVRKRLLPYGGYPFYEVGNLHHIASDYTPEYISEDYTHHIDTSNMDRLIISMRPDRTVDKVYVTQHKDLSNFDPLNTYRISRGLLMTICGHPSADMSLSNFLEQAGYSTHEPISIMYQGIAAMETGDTRINMEVESRAPPRAAPGFWESGTMVQVQTLNNMAELRTSGFGRPSPRHGLKLLFWFAKDYIVIKNDNQMVAKYDPKEGGFGFRLFKNRLQCDNNKLLPDDGYTFYEVGDLHHTASKSLPKYVRKYNTGDIDTSNMDRLIISMRPDRTVDKVYVTQHKDLKNFAPLNTYCIRRELLMIICGQSLEIFLKEAGYSTHGIAPRESGDTRIDMEAGSRAAPGFWESYCTIL